MLESLPSATLPCSLPQLIITSVTSILIAAAPLYFDLIKERMRDRRIKRLVSQRQKSNQIDKSKR